MTKPNAEAEASLTRKRLAELLHYDHNSGHFVWKVSVGRCRQGEWAGCRRRPDKQVTITIEGRNYFAHRLAFLWMTRSWPQGRVIHRDGNPRNNAWSNLRVVRPRKATPRKVDLGALMKSLEAHSAG